MKRIYHRYEKWEDWQHGLYNKTVEYDELEQEKRVKLCIDFLSNQQRFFTTALNVLNNWPISSDVNLSNVNRNRQAWIGQASCCYELGVPEFITKWAWRTMELNNQKEANQTANKIIKLWEEKHAK